MQVTRPDASQCLPCLPDESTESRKRPPAGTPPAPLPDERTESRKRPPAGDPPALESAKRERRVETGDDCTQDTVTRPSFLLGQPSASMLDSWLQEDVQQGAEGPVVKRIPEGIRVLVPMIVDGDGVLNLCHKVRNTKGASVVALLASEDAVQTFFKCSCVEFKVDTLRYEPPWYMNASKLEHLTRPMQVYTALHSPLTVYACDLMDPSFNLHGGVLKGSFHRVWDQGKVAHTAPAQRAELMRTIRSYAAAPAQLLVSCSVHEPGEVESTLPGTAYSIRFAEMRELCGSNSTVHLAKQVKRSGAPLSWLGLSLQQGCVYWIWLVEHSEAEGSSYMRPPSCPCCK